MTDTSIPNETLAEFRARMQKRGELPQANRMLVVWTERFEQRRPDVPKADRAREVLAHVSGFFPFSEEELREIEQRVEAETRAEDLPVNEQSKPAETTMASEEDPTTAAEMDELVARCDGDQVDLGRDLTWAYQNLGKRIGTVRPADAPSPGAWTQLHFARQNPNKFIETVNKILGKRIEERNKSVDRDDGSSLEELHRRFETEVLEMP